MRADNTRVEELQEQAISAAEESLAKTERCDNAHTAADWSRAAKNAAFTALNCEQILATRNKANGGRR